MELSNYKDKRICVAVSGGADSMALLHFMKENATEYGYRICAVNFEHGIRGEESLADSRFVQSICLEWGVELYSFSEDCVKRAALEKTSLETAARNFRNSKYDELIKTGKADLIATAHHANDVAETVLFRISRGAALSGAVGIKQAENGRIRPFLSKTKSEILDYVQKNGIPYREDSTNFQTDATRNALRLQVLPMIEERIPSAVKNIARFAAVAEEDDKFLYELAQSLIEKTEDGYAVKFSDKKPIFTRACLTAMKGLGVERDYTQTHLNDLFSLQKLRVGAAVTLPQGVFARREDGFLLLSRELRREIDTFEPIAIKKGEFELGGYQVRLSNEFPTGEFYGKILRLDYGKLPSDCLIRSREEGDLFEKYGGGTKTLKRYMIDKKIPKQLRGLPILAKDNTVYAVFGTEISEKVKTDENTKDLVYLTLRITGEKKS